MTEIGLKWIKAHQGTEGNEKADHFAKQAASKATVNFEQYPKSYIKKQLKGPILNEWFI